MKYIWHLGCYVVRPKQKKMEMKFGTSKCQELSSLKKGGEMAKVQVKYSGNRCVYVGLGWP